MTGRDVMGKEGMTLAVIAMLAMTAVAFFVDMPTPGRIDSGICIVSPDEWPLPPLTSGILNTVLIALTCATLYGVNKEYNFIKGSDTVQLGMFLIMSSSNIWVSGLLNSAMIVAIVNLISAWILFGCYRQTNATKELFIIGTLLSIGSMFEYGFVFMIPVYIIGAMMLDCFNFKVFIAYAMGIAAPYWVGIGLGLLPLDSFRMPRLLDVFTGYESKGELLIGMLNIGFTAVLGLLIGLSNAMKLYAGNTKRRLMITVLNLLGIFAGICVIIDFENLTAYLGLIYVVTAVQIGTLFELTSLPHGGWWLTGISTVYLGLFILMTLL